ncbi:DUF4238 domain-containing protein [Rothia kristinae]|uniref:DUF4238 domain-containing protein n=1 Tax=Rothia kristinae TaxID=37923 RepID=UPI0033CCA943
MPKDHFMPAAFIAQFGEIVKPRARKTLVHKLDKSGKIEHRRAENTAYECDLYNSIFDSEDGRQRFVDDKWDSYEPQIARAIKEAEEGKLNYKIWIEVFVPLVAGMLVRDKYVGEQLRQRPEFSLLVSSDDPDDFSRRNNLRLLLFDEFKGRLLCARWTLMRGKGTFITSDLGYAIFYDSVEGHDNIGLYVPINKNCCFEIIFRKCAIICSRNNNRWEKNVMDIPISSDDQNQINKMIAQFAQEFVMGSKNSVSQINADLVGERTYAEIVKLIKINPFVFNYDTLINAWDNVLEATISLNLNYVSFENAKNRLYRGAEALSYVSVSNGVLSDCLIQKGSRLIYLNPIARSNPA